MSRFIKHAPCPNCGSRDNLAVYEDNEHCFGCGYHRGTNSDYKKRESNGISRASWSSNISLPHSCVPVHQVPFGIHYLARYGVSIMDAGKYRIQWAEEGWGQLAPLLVFPVYRGSQLMYWAARNFGKVGPKWYIKGKHNDYPLLISEISKSDLVILVEDIISAIVVAKWYPTLCLFGTSISNEQISTITDFRRVGVWLDRDARKKALRIQQRLGLLKDEVTVIRGEADPKEYSQENIGEYINRYLR